MKERILVDNSIILHFLKNGRFYLKFFIRQSCLRREITTMELNYRRALPGDIQEIDLLIQKAIAKMEKNEIMQWDEFYPTQDDFLEDIQKNQLYVGYVDGRIAVVFAINQECDAEYANGKWKEPEKPFAVLHRLCVHPDFQQRGIAKQTLCYIEKKVWTEGKQAVRLDVYSKNPYAVPLYLNCGYQKVGSVEWYKGTFYLMEKYLNDSCYTEQ